MQGLLFFILLYLYYFRQQKNVNAYLIALFATNLIVFTVSLFWYLVCRKKAHTATLKPAPTSYRSFIKEVLIYGLWGSVDNMAEGLTTRLNYFLIQRVGGYLFVGLLDVGTRLSESVLHVSRSVGFLTNSQVAQTTDTKTQTHITLQSFKFTFCALCLLVFVVVLLPEWIFTDYLLTPEFQGIRHIIIGLSPGIVAFGSNHVLSNYFMGSGKIRYSAFCSIFGLVCLLIIGIFLIPKFGVFGAAITASLAYIGMFAFLLTVFVRQNTLRLRDLFPTVSDFRELYKRFRK